ncbi:uncharacterized protein LOC141752341 [Sebastes fasciatus]|uniref:uncharacterized protein LOC141752341 n=1 Tax=Sebastes fasciatus TaxID=394691 RepID=UPI003D9EFCAB
MQPTGSMETKMLPFGAVKPQQTVKQESSMQPTGSMETKMALRMFEAKWTAALVSILEELTEPQFSKLLFKLDTIPQGLKSGRTREDIPHIIIQYYGTEESISVIDKEMKLLPRNDAAVQQLLLPFVEKLKKQQQKIKEKKSKVTTESGPVTKKPKAAADTLKSCRPDEMLPFGAVKPQQTMTQESFMQPTGSMETKMLPFGAVKPQQTVTQESSMQPTGSMETKMTLMMLEAEWKAALVSILKELTEQQFSKLLFKLDTIPQAVKFDKTRQDIPHIIVQYYGTEESISVIDKEMKLLPRNDAAVQQLLLPFVEKLKKKKQKKKKKKSKVTTESGPVAKKPKAAADTLKSCRPDEMLPFGAVKPQQTVTQESSMQPTGSMETKMTLMMLEAEWKAALVSILKELTEQQFSKLLFKLDTIPQAVKFDKTRQDIPHIIVQYYGTEESISVIDKEMKLLPRNDAAVQQLLLPFVEKLKKKKQKKKKKKSKVTTESGPVAKKPKAAADTLKSCRPDEMLPFGAVKPQQTMTQESFMQPTGSMETKVQSAAVQTGRITLIRIKRSNKFYTHLVVEFNDRLQTVFVTTRLLANAFGYIANDDFMERFSYEIPLTAEAKIQGNKIIEIKNR